ncbi:DUF1858 domain-containing protein [Clostridium carnis]
MITRDMTLSEAINENHQAQQVLMSFGIGCGGINTNEMITLEEVCLRHGINIEVILKQVNFNRYY